MTNRPCSTPPPLQGANDPEQVQRSCRLGRVGCGFFAYCWKLPSYSGAFLLTVDNFSFFAYSWSFFAYSFSFFTYSWSFVAYNGKVRLIRALRDCKQRSLTVSKKAPSVSKKLPQNFFWAHARKVGLLPIPESLDGPAIRNTNRGDSRESTRRKKNLFHNARAIRANRFRVPELNPFFERIALRGATKCEL